MSGKAPDQTDLEAEYRVVVGRAEVFCEELTKQIAKLIENAGLPLAFPIQRRVKKWESLSEKFKHTALAVKSICEVQDLIGLRVILLFRRDLEKVDESLRSALKITRVYDTGQRLKEDQFGYSSRHYVIALPDEWLKVPTFTGMHDLIAEVQVRTLAQHMWAEASHFLQYKHEDTVPVSIRRALSRGSAILETFDLEFDRILAERDAYRSRPDLTADATILNVDVLEKTLDALLPQENKSDDEPYSDLLLELRHFGIQNVADLRELVDKKIAAAIQQERNQIRRAKEELSKGTEEIGTDPERLKKGIYFTHVGLGRVILSLEFGDKRLMDFQAAHKATG